MKKKTKNMRSPIKGIKYIPRTSATDNGNNDAAIDTDIGPKQKCITINYTTFHGIGCNKNK